MPPPSEELSTSNARAARCYRTILGINFYVGPMAGLLERTTQGGLIVVPSAPVLVNLKTDPFHREAMESADLAITDSGFMVLLWLALQRERLIRISGLRYLRALLQDPAFKSPGKSFWVMPTAADASANCEWLNTQGFVLGESDCYVAPQYARTGPLEDPALLALLREKRPQFVLLNLGGGVQERLGYYLREALVKIPGASSGAFDQDSSFPTDVGATLVATVACKHAPTEYIQAGASSGVLDPKSIKAETGKLKAEDFGTNPEPTSSPGVCSAISAPSTPSGAMSLSNRPPATARPQVSARAYRPAIICTGAAIAFLSGRQANIPVWADRLMLGWLLRSLGNPRQFLPRYRQSLRLVSLLWKHGARSVVS